MTNYEPMKAEDLLSENTFVVKHKYEPITLQQLRDNVVDALAEYNAFLYEERREPAYQSEKDFLNKEFSRTERDLKHYYRDLNWLLTQARRKEFKNDK